MINEISFFFKQSLLISLKNTHLQEWHSQRCIQKVLSGLDDKLLSDCGRVLGSSDSSNECAVAWHRSSFGFQSIESDCLFH